MVEIRTLNFHDKPGLGQIKNYFRTRLRGEQKGLDLIRDITYDSLGNTVYTSPGFQEATFHDPHPATLVVSQVGKNIINRNRGLLHRIAEGELLAEERVEEMPEGLEGKVYKVMLETDEGRRPFVLKYTFPIEAEAAGRIFTPGIDQMRLLQLLEQQAPPGAAFRPVVPVFATMDMILSPFVEHGFDAEDFEKAGKGNRAVLKKLDKPDQLLMEDIAHTYWANDVNDRFGTKFFNAMIRSKQHLRDWFDDQVTQLPFQPISKFFSSPEVESPRNIVISMDALRDLYTEFRQREGIFAGRWAYNDPEFMRKVQNCCHLVELTFGREYEEVLNDFRSL